MATADPSPALCVIRISSIRLPRPLWIGAVAAVVGFGGIGLNIGFPIFQQHVAIQEIRAIGGGIRYAAPSSRTRWMYSVVAGVPEAGVSGITQENAIDVLRRLVAIEEVWLWPDEATFYKRGPGRFSGPPPWIEGPSVNDGNLACVRHLPNLRFLYLRHTNVSDAGLRHICELQSLEELYLDGTDISDAGLGELAKLRRLRVVSVVGTKVTTKGVADLRSALPRCTMIYGSYDDMVVEPHKSDADT